MLFRSTKQEELLSFIWFNSVFFSKLPFHILIPLPVSKREVNFAWEAVKKEVVQGHIAEIVERF